MPGRRVYEVAPLPGKLHAPVPHGHNVFGDQTGDMIMGRLRKSRFADAGRVGKKVYLANFTFPTHDLDPRILTRVSSSPNGFYPSVLLFERKEGGKGFIAFCAVNMPSEEAAQALIDAVMKQGTIEREVGIVPGAKEYAPITLEQRLCTSMAKDQSNGYIVPQELTEMKKKYLETFAKAMSTTSPSERLQHYRACKALAAMGKARQG